MNPLVRFRLWCRVTCQRLFRLSLVRKMLVAGLVYLLFLGLAQLPGTLTGNVFGYAHFVLWEYQVSWEWEQLRRQVQWLETPTTWLPVTNPLLPGEQETVPTLGEESQREMVMPVEGEITSGFGWRLHPVLEEERFHYGIDISAPEGAPIRAVAGGLVSRVEDHEELGQVVVLDHGGGLETLYAHCSEVLVAENQPVQAGEVIARVGNTGLAENPHLHFEVKERGVNVDPAEWLIPAEEDSQ